MTRGILATIAAAQFETMCWAVDARKSTTESFDQPCESLDAQRDACTGYIQRQPGWTVLERSDDGGTTPANVDRPVFQRLLRDIAAGKFDVVFGFEVPSEVCPEVPCDVPPEVLPPEVPPEVPR